MYCLWYRDDSFTVRDIKQKRIIDSDVLLGFIIFELLEGTQVLVQGKSKFLHFLKLTPESLNCYILLIIHAIVLRNLWTFTSFGMHAHGNDNNLNIMDVFSKLELFITEVDDR